MLFSVNESSESSFCFLAGGFVPVFVLVLLVSVLACRFGFSVFSDWNKNNIIKLELFISKSSLLA